MSLPAYHSFAMGLLRSTGAYAPALMLAAFTGCAKSGPSLTQTLACESECESGLACDTSVGECRSLCDKSIAAKCAAGLECTSEGFCAPLAVGDACDDGDPCTINDRVKQSGCKGETVACGPQEACHPDTGDCAATDAIVGAACDDGNACTDDDAYALVDGDILCMGADKECPEGFACSETEGLCVGEGAVIEAGQRCQTHCLGASNLACLQGLDGLNACVDEESPQPCLNGHDGSGITGTTDDGSPGETDGDIYSCDDGRWTLTVNDGFAEGDACPAGTCGSSGLQCLTSIYGVSMCASPGPGQCLLKANGPIFGFTNDGETRNGALEGLRGEWICDQGTWVGACGAPGTACDDGDPDTINDICLEDSANCAGSPL